MAAKASIATQDEILKRFTDIMRGSIDKGEVKINESISAGEKLYKMLRERQNEEEDKKVYGVVILPDVSQNDIGGELNVQGTFNSHVCEANK